MNKQIKDFKVEIGTRFKDDKRDITIIDRKKMKDKNGIERKYYKYFCNLCGFDCGEHYKNGEYREELWSEEVYLLNRKQGCACCTKPSHIVVEQINSIYKTDTWMIPYIGEECAKTHTHSSNDSIYPICSECGRIKDKPMTIYNIYKYHSIGCICGDGIKYPNKFIFNILKQLNINFINEYNPAWIKPKRYDFYFKINNKEYILEMDGGLGHGKKDNPKSGQTSEESKYIDDEKDKIARTHGIEVIRIDCDYRSNDRFEYIKNNILNDKKLNQLFNLSKIDWLKAEEFALSNLVKVACGYKRNNHNLTSIEIGEIIGYCKATIIKWLKQGNNLNWCVYNTKEEMSKSGNTRGKMRCKPIEIFKNGISLGIFPSCTELEKQSEKLFGIKLYTSEISCVCNINSKRHKNEYKGYTFKYVEEKEVY